MSLISGKCSFVLCEETNVRFVLFYCVIFVHKMFTCSKSMMLNNFVIDFFPVSCTVFEIKTLTQNFDTGKHCKWFHCLAHGHFTIPRHHFYKYSSFRLEIIRVAMDLSGHTVYITNYKWPISCRERLLEFFNLFIVNYDSKVLKLFFEWLDNRF